MTHDDVFMYPGPEIRHVTVCHCDTNDPGIHQIQNVLSLQVFIHVHDLNRAEAFSEKRSIQPFDALHETARSPDV